MNDLEEAEKVGEMMSVETIIYFFTGMLMIPLLYVIIDFLSDFIADCVLRITGARKGGRKDVR